MNLLSTEKPLESSIYSGAPHKNRAQGDKTAERPSSTYGNLIDESARSGDQNTTRQAPGEHEPECVTSCGPNVQVIHQPASGFPAIKKSALDLGGVAKSGSSKKSRGKKGKGVDRSRQFSIRDNSRSDADPDIPISSSTQDSMVVDSSQSPQSQQQSETWGEFTKSPRLRGQEYAEALTATPLKVLQKPRKRKGAGKRQTLSNKRHLVHINAANQSPSASQNTPTSLTRGSDNLLLDRQPSQTLTEGFSDTPCQDRVGKPVYNPLSNVPIIDLTRSPDQEIVKQELGWTTESLEVRMSRLTANLNGVASLTPEKIKEIIDHSVSARLSDAAHQVVEEFGKTLEKRMDQLRRDWRPLDDNRD
ncbi:hypothetical protein F5B19DRAFT_474537 [Rostrohypoxylon terebratum]|nr:hypothetical protein F5B19DRAFT_474537 [Rostrohypoxylon terebratum]